MKSNKKYVVLEHLTLPNRGLRFWSTNSENNTHGYNGELWYKEVGFTDDDKEAIKLSKKTNFEVLPSTDELIEYYKNDKAS